jgi:hypothetical protein
MTAPRTGGTIAHPARLYRPGSGSCPSCGAENVPTYANGRLGAHSPAAVSTLGMQVPYRVRTCPGWSYPSAETA